MKLERASSKNWRFGGVSSEEQHDIVFNLTNFGIF